jgi:hypothetical protein
VLHARTNPISQGIAAWPPLALLLTVELVSRVPVHRRSLAVVRIAATTAIAGIAAWVSYWHMAGVCARYGESPVSAHLMPLSVDGLVIAASISLVELAGRLRALDAATAVAQPAPAAKVASPRAATRTPAKKTTRAAKVTSPGKAAKAATGRAPEPTAAAVASTPPAGTGATPQAASNSPAAAHGPDAPRPTEPVDQAAPPPQLASVAS